MADPLPTGTVTLLLADVECSTALWQNDSDDMLSAVAELDRTLADAVVEHNGVRPLEQGEGDSFVIAFARATDAVACALDLQRTDLDPIRLRIGIHTGEVQLRDEQNYIGPTINRTARLRDLGHGGQTLISGATESLVVDYLPNDVILVDLGTHTLRDLPRPERVIQLNGSDAARDFPPLRSVDNAGYQHLPRHLTKFVGRRAESAEVRRLLADNRLVTLAGAGGAGKTRLALQVAVAMADDFAGGVWNVDLAPVPHPDVVPVAVARALGLPDQPGRSTSETIIRYIGTKRMLVILDNCEHLLDGSATLAGELLAACANLTLLITSREPIGIAGESIWRVPGLSLADDAVELFADRARTVRPDFRVTDDNAGHLRDICQRLDGLPLAIELAAARVRALSLVEIIDSLRDRFRLLTGGSRTAVRRQQTLHASVDWSHALLSEPERALFRRLSVFLGGFDLDAAQFVCGGVDFERYQTLDQLMLLVDKSLVVAEDHARGTRYRLLETMRQYALEKLGESGQSDDVRTRHLDHFAAIASALEFPSGDESRFTQAELEMDNLRGALGWCLENGDIGRALTLASSLQAVWLGRGRIREGRAWFETIFAAASDELRVPDSTRARALADRALLDMWAGAASLDQAKEAVDIARRCDDPTLLLRALTACGHVAAYADGAEAARTYLAEATDLARVLDDRWRLCDLLAWQGGAAVIAGDPRLGRAASQEGLTIADTIGSGVSSRNCRTQLGWAMLMEGNVVGAVTQFREAVDACVAAHDAFLLPGALQGLGIALFHNGAAGRAREAGEATLTASLELGDLFLGMGYTVLQGAELAAGDVQAAHAAAAAAWKHLSFQPHTGAVQRARNSEVALLSGDVSAARRWADEAITCTTGWHRALALVARARVSLVEGLADAAERDTYDALECATRSESFVVLPDILELLATLRTESGNPVQAARMFGAAQAFRERNGIVRLTVYDDAYAATVAALDDVDTTWAEGAAMSTEEAIAYAQRGRGTRKRPETGWESLTPAELDVVTLVADGLTNKDVAARLFISPRTVQAHLAHVFTKLGVTTRTQLAQEATRRA